MGRPERIVVVALGGLLISGLTAGACGSSPSAPSTPPPTQNPPPGAIYTLNGRVVGTVTEQPIAGAAVTIGGQSVTTDASGAFTISSSTADVRDVTIRGDGLIPRKTHLSVASRNTTIDVIQNRAPFSLGFFRQIARNAFESESGLEELRPLDRSPAHPHSHGGRGWPFDRFADAEPRRGGVARLRGRLVRWTISARGRRARGFVESGTNRVDHRPVAERLGTERVRPGHDWHDDRLHRAAVPESLVQLRQPRSHRASERATRARARVRVLAHRRLRGPDVGRRVVGAILRPASVGSRNSSTRNTCTREPQGTPTPTTTRRRRSCVCRGSSSSTIDQRLDETKPMDTCRRAGRTADWRHGRVRLIISGEIVVED